MIAPGIILAVVATVIYNLGFILEKRALDRLPAIDVHQLVHLARTLFTAPAWLAGFLLICCGLVLQVLVLSLEPLIVAQPLQASGVVVTILFARLVLHERLGRAELTCIGLIAVAVALLSLSSGSGPGAEAGTHAAGAAIAAAAVPACLVVPVIYYQAQRASSRRHRARATGVSYGCCAGLVYGFAGVALKALSASIFTTSHPRDGLLAAAAASPYLYAMLASSAIGMCLFQVALQRSPASIVMPVSLIISTGYLVIIGSWLFHERLPASPVLLALRLCGAVAAIAAPVILNTGFPGQQHRIPGHHRLVPVPRAASDQPSPTDPAAVRRRRRHLRAGHPNRRQRTGYPLRSDDVLTSAAATAAAHDPRREERRILPGHGPVPAPRI